MKGAMLGAGIGGGHGAPGSPWCHTGTFQLSKGVDAKRQNPFLQCPNPRIPCVIQQETPQKRKRPLQSSGGRWDTEASGMRGVGLGEGDCVPSLRLLPPSIRRELGTAMERKRTAQEITPNPPFPSSASIRDGCGFC